MTTYQVIDELCKIVNELSDLVKKQQEEMEMAGCDLDVFLKIKNSIETKMDVAEYHIRHV